MSSLRVVIVGAGVIGLTHAITAREAGHEVTVLERDGRALGASVRNFGTLWPIGCTAGPEREQALFGVRRWKEVAEATGIWCRASGSLTLAYREEAWGVLTEFGADDGTFELLEPRDVRRRFPAANPTGLRGALFSAAEACVHPPSAMAGLAAHAQRIGVTLHCNTLAVRVARDRVDTSDGRSFAFDQLVIAAGEDMRLLFPEALAAAEVVPCRLQMLRTVAQPAGFDLGAILVSDLTLGHYPAFRDCPSTPALRARLAEELPDHTRWGVHVIAAQHADGTLTLGDSHEYGPDLPMESHAEVEALILDALREFAMIPALHVAARWQGVYLRSTVGRTQVVLHPQERVTMVAAMGGLGMTLGWGLARDTVAGWSA
jgi:FAD dependent oxidoreductase TIGR03364